jgi:asparagine synthase (glutamine-hydrolysing)
VKEILKELDLNLRKIFEEYKQRYNKLKIGVFVSGGIDSSIVAFWVKKIFPEACFFSLTKESSHDWEFLNILEKFLSIKVTKFDYSASLVKRSFDEVREIYRKNFFSADLTQISLGVGFWMLLEEVSKRKVKVVFSGQGPDVLLGGYHRYKKIKREQLNKAIIKDLKELEKDKEREKMLADCWGIKIVYPYLEKEIFNLFLRLPPDLKIKEDKEKYILRKYGEFLNLPAEIVNRPKKAFQYSSGIYKEVKKLLKS